MNVPLITYEAALDDGTKLRFRPIEPSDKDLLVRGFNELSPESRYRRFFHPIDHLTEADLRYLTEIDYVNHFAWLALLDEPGEPGVGVGRWVRLANERDVAEAAITVVDRYQNRGIGTILLRLLAHSAVENGIRHLRAWVMAENQPVIDLLKAVGAKLGRIDGGLRELDAPLPDDAEQIDVSPARVILREVAAGNIEAGVDPMSYGRTRLR